MALIRTRRSEPSPFEELWDIHNDLSRLFDFDLERGSSLASTWTPLLDVYEDKDHVVVKAELPGLEEKDVDISLERNTLTIKGEKKFETEVKEEGFYRSERRYGKFQRMIDLPAQVDTSAVKATYKHGVLEIRLSKKEEVKPKQIPIEVEK